MSFTANQISKALMLMLSSGGLSRTWAEEGCTLRATAVDPPLAFHWEAKVEGDAEFYVIEQSFTRVATVPHARV